ncbi:MAG: hypothetical protein R3B99_08015 [Polyangiales bacterium]
MTLDFYADRTEWVHDDAFTLAFAEAHQAIRDAARDAAPEDERLRPRLRRARQRRADAPAHRPRGAARGAPHLRRAHARGRRIASTRSTPRRSAWTPWPLAWPATTRFASRLPPQLGRALPSPPPSRPTPCTAAPGVTEQPVGVYPAAFQATEGFSRASRPPAASSSILHRRRRSDGTLAAVPYTTAYAAGMGEVAASFAPPREPSPPTPKAALVACERGRDRVRDQRLGPRRRSLGRDERAQQRVVRPRRAGQVYWDPCSLKAGFHLTFARIDRDSLIWQDRLAPVRQSSRPRSPRSSPRLPSARRRLPSARLHRPSSRTSATTATPSARRSGRPPELGPVAEESRGRTVAMTNLYTDSDSLARRREVAASLLSPETFAVFSDDLEPGLVSTILHEAAHNLGPAQEYRVDGRDDTAIFGGGMASMLEELKAQTSALFFLELLQQRQLWDDAKIQQTALDSMVWALGHVSRPMYTPEGNRKAYSQLAAIQVGYLMENGAFRWDANAVAANGTDRGCFTLDFDAFPRVARALMTEVMRIKATGDAEAANALAARYVDGDVVPMAIVVERHRRSPRASFVYAIDR